MLTLLLACSPPGPSVSAPSGLDGDTLVWAVSFDPGNANPVVPPYQLSATLIDVVQPGLVRRGTDAQGITYEPALAESWAWSDDGLQLRYTLREGLLWEDGTPLTSADVAFTYDLARDPVVASNWKARADRVVGIDTPDDRTVVFRFDAARSHALQQSDTTIGIVARHQLLDADRASLRGQDSAREPLASGPFAIASWQPQDRIVLVPNDKAPAEWRPHLDRILLRVIPEYATRVIELETGAVDLLTGVELPDVPRLAANPDLVLRTLPRLSMQYIGYNLADPRFTDDRVRRALALGLDRQRMIQDLFTADGKVYASPCVGTVTPDAGTWFDESIQPLPFDPLAAAALLDEAGWTDSDADGVRDRNGQPLRFSLMLQHGESITQRIAVTAQGYYKQLGVDMQLLVLEPNTFSNKAREHDFEAILWGFGASTLVDPQVQWHSTGMYNWMGLADPEIDRLIDEGLSAADDDVARADFRQVQRRIYELQPATFLFWVDDVVAIHKRFADAELDPTFTLRRADTWSVPPEQRRY